MYLDPSLNQKFKFQPGNQVGWEKVKDLTQDSEHTYWLDELIPALDKDVTLRYLPDGVFKGERVDRLVTALLNSVGYLHPVTCVLRREWDPDGVWTVMAERYRIEGCNINSWGYRIPEDEWPGVYQRIKWYRLEKDGSMVYYDGYDFLWRASTGHQIRSARELTPPCDEDEKA